LPAVTSRQIVLTEPTVFLAAEPILETHAPSLVEAARGNDYAMFDALYREAKQRGEKVAQFDTLHELWTWANHDPIGAFYGPDLHARFARAYPGYAAYIEDYRIVDDRGNVFYPTSETRTFLLDRIVEGNAPRVLLAERTPASPAADTPALPAVTAVHKPAASHHAARSHRTVAAPVPAAAAVAVQTAPAAAKTPVQTTVTTAPVASAPVEVASTPPATTTSAPAPSPVSEAPVTVAAVPPAASEPVTAQPAQNVKPEESGATSRGLLLLVIGIIGIGLLAVMLRTPREAGPVSIMTPQ